MNLKFKLTFLLILIINTVVFAGTKGKLAGWVKDKQTNEPLVGVNVYLENTNLGAATDENGEFIIINISPGKYTIKVEYIGYGTNQIDNVSISTDLTTILNIELQEGTLETENIIVMAERPLIRKDLTSKLSIIDGNQITSMPVSDFNDVVASQAGITTDADGNLHFRGGRTNEVTFLVDGQIVENPINNSFSGLIDNYAISELQILSGTFNAEYGQAMSGVINIVTKSGSDKIKVKVDYSSPMLNSSPYRKKNALVADANPYYDKQNNRRLYYKANDGLDEVNPLFSNEGSFSGFLSGPLPYNIGTFFFSGEYLNENSWLPYGYNFSRSTFAKLTVPVGVNKISAIWQHSDQQNQPYEHRYKYIPDGQGHWETASDRLGLQYNHVLSAVSYFVLNASMLNHQSLFRVGSIHYSDYIFPDLDDKQEFYIGGNSQEYSDFSSKTFNIKGDWLIQLGRHHEVKSGLEYNLYMLDVFDYTNELDDAFILNEYEKNPYTLSFYVQDKIEYESIILNAGVRADYVDATAEGFTDIENPQAGLKDTKPELKISPRLGLAYPISENTVFHFSYGHFLQFPNFQNLYQNLQFLNPAILEDVRFAIVANPRVKSEKTTSYEFGVSQKVGDNLAFNISAFSKDVTDLLGTTTINKAIGSYSIFINNDFARFQGVDFSLEKRMSNNWGMKIDYTYSVARGNESHPLEEAYNIFEGQPKSVKEFYLDFDRRHDIALNLMLRLPARPDAGFTGLLLSDLNLSILAQFSSGLPYTPISDDFTKRFEKNSARMPWTKTVDLRLEKFFRISQFTYSFYLETTNLFDWLNPLVVQPRTGKVWDDGQSTLFGSGEDAKHDPSNVGFPRIVKLGATVAL